MNLEHRVPPVVVWLSCAALTWQLARIQHQPRLTFAGRVPLVFLLVVASLFIGAGGLKAFQQNRTTVDPLAPERASQLVTGGVYGFTRNPMYVALAGLLAAWGVLLGRPAALLGVPVFVAYITQYQIKPEERALKRLFGQDYLAYKQRVRRWI